MFCPKCGTEYRQGFATCADCNAALVYEWPSELRPENKVDKGEPVEYVEILETYSPADIAFIKSILDAESITYFIKGEYIGCIQPLADRFKLMVSQDQAEEVKSLLADMKISFFGMGSETDEPESDETEEAEKKE
ncbi:MAG: hypothetical protein EHM45_11425 [Desulfobacteraceae bacterium]|nr:MAG: hypothetical protein EHM45_11425 [Desulfobacteraceae bacterium]